MRLWFTRPGARVSRTWVKRFDPHHWTIDFPLGAMASLVTSSDGHGFTATCEFLRKGDLVGLIWESEDRHSHPAHARATSRDFSNAVLSFRWQSAGILALNAVNGPTLTIEGRDSAGNARSWFVRLWNYATGSPTDARVTIDFDALDGGFSLPADAQRVNPKAIERMFISLVAPGYVAGSAETFASPAQVSVTLSELKCDGAGSVLSTGDAMVPEHPLGVATGYDDLYHLPPERVIEAIERLGYRGTINHYLGMSHYFALGADGRLDPARGLNSAALAWHRDFARAAKARGYALIWSISYEILADFCPAAWQQRASDGSPALTGWSPPSALLSPAKSEAMDFLEAIAVELAGLADEAGLLPQVQIGEPWWWVKADGAICLYDDAAKAALGGNPIAIPNVRESLTQAQKQLLDDAGALLASSTAGIAAAVRQQPAGGKVLLLAYLPTVLDQAAPELKRANLPTGWASPAFDVLQLEDYEWVTGGRSAARNTAYAEVEQRLGYAPDRQHYLAGFVAAPEQREQWPAILAAAEEARKRGCAETFIWALPQLLRDGVTLFGEEEEVDPFDDVLFPIEIGKDASVAPGFSTSVVTSASGFERRNAQWSQARMRFDAGPGVRGEAELQELLAFFRTRRGPAIAFRFRDPYDHSSAGMTGTPGALDQRIGTGDGIADGFELIKSYGGGEQRRITRPVAGSVSVAVNGTALATGWTLEPKGVIRFASPPAAGAAVTAGFQFDTPVRFADDRIEINRATFLAGEAPSVPLVEVREA